MKCIQFYLKILIELQFKYELTYKTQNPNSFQLQTCCNYLLNKKIIYNVHIKNNLTHAFVSMYDIVSSIVFVSKSAWRTFWLI